VRTAVVGHVEWVEFARVERVPKAGEIVRALEWWEEPAGGGSVAAVQLFKLAGDCTFFTALGRDATGKRAHLELEALGPRVEAARRPATTRRGVAFIDASGERTITAWSPAGTIRSPGTSSRASTPSTSRRATPERFGAHVAPACSSRRAA
jgi:ribokinase